MRRTFLWELNTSSGKTAWFLKHFFIIEHLNNCTIIDNSIYCNRNEERDRERERERGREDRNYDKFLMIEIRVKSNIFHLSLDQNSPQKYTVAWDIRLKCKPYTLIKISIDMLMCMCQMKRILLCAKFGPPCLQIRTFSVRKCIKVFKMGE